MKFIFVTGGVVSSVGKGISSAIIGTLLQSKGYKVRLRKMDPYFNVDPGTMSPYQHGEVFVTEDGGETDLDLGHYERFTNVSCRKSDSVSSGKIFYEVLNNERNGKYLGGTVQIIPHITDHIKNYIQQDLDNEDFVICEIGGTVGDIEANPFLEAVRQLRNDKGADNVMFIHVTLLPFLISTHEVKTKPTQHSVKSLQATGISPNILICRSDIPIDDVTKNKLALFCNVAPSDVIEAVTCNHLEDLVLKYDEQGLSERICEYFNYKYIPTNLSTWKDLIAKRTKIEHCVNLCIVGKYTPLKDAYKSLEEAVNHAALNSLTNVNISWILSEDIDAIKDQQQYDALFKNTHGILIPGGFGDRGVEGKIKTLEYARTKGIPCLGICLGAQMMVVEALRNIIKLPDVGSSEFGTYDNSVISLLTKWNSKGSIETRSTESKKGGTMRLGSYDCNILPNTLAEKIYNQSAIKERHRHRYEINIEYKNHLNQAGFVISGISPDGLLPEMVELKGHPWFMGVQFHPELQSRPFKPHVIFTSLIDAMINYKGSI